MTNEEIKEIYGSLMARRASAPRDGCPPPEDLQGVAEGSASSAERLRIMEHVSGCPGCQRELALLGTVADAGRRALPASRTRWVLLAASVAAVALGVRAYQRERPEAPVVRGDEASVVLSSPVGARVEPGELRLAWHPLGGAARYEVEVLDSAGRPVHTATVRDTVLTLPPSPRLPEGGSFRWHVTAIRADGTRIESPMASFVVGPGSR